MLEIEHAALRELEAKLPRDWGAYAAFRLLVRGSDLPDFFVPFQSWRTASVDFSRPGKPTDNAKNESFNGRFREECLNAHWFLSLEDARRKIEVWREYYNEARPHSALQWTTPAEFARQCTDRAGSARPEE
ncbi:integrase core domain protein [Burkholderia pseudomallei MSHR7500]|nr:integrase core domain protein [Burkholderia pseudomallei MSHR7500]